MIVPRPPIALRPPVEQRPNRVVPSGRAASWVRVRLRVWASSLELDRQLAAGVAPALTAELSLRASQLASARSQHALQVGLLAVVDAAARPNGRAAARAPVLAGRVTDAAGPLVSLARDLRVARDPPVRALAQVSLLLCDATSSPIYNRASPQSLRDLAHRTRATIAERCGAAP